MRSSKWGPFRPARLMSTGKIPGSQQWPARDDCCPLDHVSQLQHVAGPSIQPKYFQAFIVDAGYRFSILLRGLRNKRLDQRGNIFEPVAQRRRLDDESIETGE